MSELKLSVVVPAFNEEKLIANSLAVLCASIKAAGYADSQWELLVCDNASNDTTAQLAAAAGASVVYEPQRQISRARNTGAAAASAPWLLFVDADTTPSAELMRATRGLMERGNCCAGGALVDGAELPFLTRTLLLGAWNTFSRALGLACGAYVFCRREAFTDLGGFSTELYAGEEIDLCWRLRRWGNEHGEKLVIITEPRLRTSMRKLDLYTPAEILMMFARAVLHPTRVLKSRRYLDHWYDGRR